MALDIVWSIHDREALLREFQLLFAGSPVRDQAVARLMSRFEEDLKLHPMEWPTSKMPVSEHTWMFGHIAVRYRLLPDGQTVQILLVQGGGRRS